MFVGIYDNDFVPGGIFHFNIDAMKIASYYKRKGDIVRLIRQNDNLQAYDKVYFRQDSRIKKPNQQILGLDNVEYGGKYFTSNSVVDLPQEILDMPPDITLYDGQPYKQNSQVSKHNRFIIKNSDFITVDGLTSINRIKKVPYIIDRNLFTQQHLDTLTEIAKEYGQKCVCHYNYDIDDLEVAVNFACSPSYTVPVMVTYKDVMDTSLMRNIASSIQMKNQLGTYNTNTSQVISLNTNAYIFKPALNKAITNKINKWKFIQVTNPETIYKNVTLYKSLQNWCMRGKGNFYNFVSGVNQIYITDLAKIDPAIYSYSTVDPGTFKQKGGIWND